MTRQMVTSIGLVWLIGASAPARADEPGAAPPQAAAPAATLSLERITEGIRESASALLDSPELLLECDWVSTKEFATGKYTARAEGFRFVYAWQEPDSFLVKVDHYKSPNKSPERIAIAQGGIYMRLHGINAIIQPEPDSTLWNYWTYTDNLFLNVYKKLPFIASISPPPPETEQPFLPEELEAHPRDYKVLPAQEAVDGAWCHVVERPGVDRIWVDPECGFAIRKRDLNWGPGLPRNKVVTNGDYKQVKPGLWLPGTQVIDSYPDPRSEDRKIWDKLATQATIKLTKADFGPLGADVFRAEIPDGTNVYDNVRMLQYRKQSKDDAPFAAAIAFAQTHGGGASRGYVALLAVGLVAGVICAAVLARMAWRGRRGKGGQP